jgi:hypothetical protein
MKTSLPFKAASILKKYGYKETDYVIKRVLVKRDTMNVGFPDHQEVEEVLLPTYVADHVQTAIVNFQMDNIRFMDKDNRELFSTVSEGYDDIVTPIAFLLA